MKMGRYRLKNYILFSLIFLSQIHTLVRGCGFRVYWNLNDLSKTLSLSTFLFIKHLTSSILLYILLKPKGVNKDLVLFLFSVSILDIIHFVSLSGFSYEIEKIALSFALFFILKNTRCLKY